MNGLEVVSQSLDDSPEAISEILLAEVGGKRLARELLDAAMMQALDDEKEIDRAASLLAAGDPQSALFVPVGF